MKVAMVSPSPESEKALSAISMNLVNGLKKKGASIDFLDYTAGSPMSFSQLFPKLKNYDLIHLQQEYNLLGYYGLPFFLAFPLLKLTNKKIIIAMHTVLSQKEKFYDNRLKNLLRRTFYKIQNWMIDKASEIIVVNENFYKKILIEDYRIDAKKIKVVPQPVPEPKITKKAKAKEELGFSGKVYLMIGNLTPDNGADIVIRQAGKIGKTIVFAANPKSVNTRNKKRVNDYIKLNKEIVRKNGFEKLVRFDLKEIPYELWWKYFSAADLVLQAYRGGIRSGVFSDAMAAKIPVIASNIFFFREMAKKYRSLKIAQNEKDYPKLIREALKPKNYQEMKKECGRYIRENSLSVVSQKYKEIYSSL